MIIGIISGFFDPFGIQHLELIKASTDFVDYLIVGVNSDECSLKKKKQPPFIPFSDRIKIMKALKYVDEVVAFNDDNGTAIELIKDIYYKYKYEVDNDIIQLIFINGGDRQLVNTPEEDYVNKHLKNKVIMKYSVGGDNKIASSSDYLRNWVNNTMIKYNIDFRLKEKY